MWKTEGEREGERERERERLTLFLMLSVICVHLRDEIESEKREKLRREVAIVGKLFLQSTLRPFEYSHVGIAVVRGERGERE